MIRQSDEVVRIKAVEHLKRNKAARTITTPCARILLHYRAALGQDVVYLESALISSRLLSHSIDLVHSERERIVALRIYSVQSDVHLGCCVIVGRHRNLEILVSGLLRCSHHVAVVNGADRIGTVIADNESHIRRLVLLAVDSAESVDAGSVSLNAGENNLQSRAILCRLVHPLQIRT